MLLCRSAKQPKKDRNIFTSRAIIALLIIYFVQAQVVNWYIDLPSLDRNDPQGAYIHAQGIHLHVGRLVRFLNSFDNPETVLFGSSIIQIPSLLADLDNYPNEVLEITPIRLMIMQNLLHSNFLERRVSTNLRRPATVLDAGVPGSVVKDDLLITQKILESRKQPKLFVYCIGLRDFVVKPTSGPASDKSPVEQLFADYDPLPYALKFSSPVINVFSYLEFIFELSPPYHAYCDWLRIMAANSRMKTYDLAMQIQCSTLKLKGCRLVSQAAAAIAKLTEPPPSYYSKKTAKAAAHAELPYLESVSKPALHADLQYMRFACSEKSIPYMYENFAALERIFQIVQARHARCLVVQMPFTARLKGEQRGRTAELYDQKLAELLQKYNIPTWTADAKKTWSDKCFTDDVHLNLIGAKKLFSLLSEQISDLLAKPAYRQ